MKKPILLQGSAHACYFRTTVELPYHKALIQITERCNLSCAHCFVSAKKRGKEISLGDFRDKILPQFIKLNVVGVTLTGGEPFTHADLIDIVLMFVNAGMDVTICTNATLIRDDDLTLLKQMDKVSMNVSLDGFAAESHGKFRGNKNSFYVTRTKMLDPPALFTILLDKSNVLVVPWVYCSQCLYVVLHYCNS